MQPTVFPRNLHAGWLQGFALPCAYESALFSICFCFAIVTDFSIASLVNLQPCPSCPRWKSDPCKYCVREVFPLKILQCGGAGWWLLVGLVPTDRVAMETSQLWGPPPTFHDTSSQAHLLVMGLNYNI